MSDGTFNTFGDISLDEGRRSILDEKFTPQDRSLLNDDILSTMRQLVSSADDLTLDAMGLLVYEEQDRRRTELYF